MTIQFRPYQLGEGETPSNDFMKVRNFLSKTYQDQAFQGFQGPRGTGLAWTIERWNFAHSLARIINGTSELEWSQEIGLWESEGQLVALVCSEGERKGEVHFSRAFDELPEAVLDQMFDYAESHLGIVQEGERLWQLRIRQGDLRLETMAAARGYSRTSYHEALSQVLLTAPIETQLPEGYQLVPGDQVTAAEKAQVHSLSFGYSERTEIVAKAVQGYAQMALEPDYKPSLDLYLKSPEGEILGFCCIWHDVANQLGILEPVGTLERVHGQGLGRLIVEAAMNKAFEAGARTFHVGTDKGFYLAIGFEKQYEVPIWEKRERA